MTKPKNYKIKWSSGTGSEILAVAIAILGLLFIVTICVFCGKLNSEVQAQILADIIIDGSCAYAKNDMNLAEEPLLATAQRLYDANKELNNGVELTGYHVDGPMTIANYTGDALGVAERKDLQNRARIMSGSLTTEVFNNYQSGIFKTLATEYGSSSSSQFEGISDLYDTGIKTRQVQYNGPQFMDQIVTISVEAQYQLPFFKNLTTSTKSATSLSIATIPYNSRISANSDYQSTSAEIESKAYEECYLSDSERLIDDPNRVKYGSIVWKELLTARRSLGDGYNKNNIDDYPWLSHNPPQLVAWGGIEGTYNNQNCRKDCYHFVSSCFHFKGCNGLSDALSQYPHKSYYRSPVTYKRNISAEEIWKEMHPDRIEKTFGATMSSLQLKIAVLLCKAKYPKLKNLINASKPYYWYDSGNFRYVTSSGGWALGFTATADEVKELTCKNGKYKVVIQKGEGKTLAEEIQELSDFEDIASGSTKRKLWSVEKASDNNFTIDDLQVGDVLVWYNPNRYTNIILELTRLAAMEEPDESVFAEMDNNPYLNGVSKVICHYSIYFGKDASGTPMQLHCTSGKGGIAITPIDIEAINADSGYSGAILQEYYRFTDDGSIIPGEETLLVKPSYELTND